jgi:hypothetical protein
MLAAIRRHRLLVVSLAIAGVAAGFGLSGSHHHGSGYQSKSVIQLLRGIQVHSMRKTIGSAQFWRNVAGQRPYFMNGTPGWIVIVGPANATKSHITTQPVSGRVFDITATASSPHQAASMVRAVTTDFDLFMHNGASLIHILTYATNPVPVASSSSSSSVEYGSIGLGAGLGLGLLLAASLAAFPASGRDWGDRPGRRGRAAAT